MLLSVLSIYRSRHPSIHSCTHATNAAIHPSIHAIYRCHSISIQLMDTVQRLACTYTMSLAFACHVFLACAANLFSCASMVFAVCGIASKRIFDRAHAGHCECLNLNRPYWFMTRIYNYIEKSNKRTQSSC